MLAAHLDPLPASLFSLLAIGSLLLSFVMLGSRWLRHYLYAFATQSWLIAILSATVVIFPASLVAVRPEVFQKPGLRIATSARPPFFWPDLPRTFAVFPQKTR